MQCAKSVEDAAALPAAVDGALGGTDAEYCCRGSGEKGRVRRAALDDAQVALLQGEWQLVWQQNSEKATRSQRRAPLPQFSNFIVDERQRAIFRNIVSINKRVQVVADVEYSPPSASAADGERAPANRLNSRICAAGLTVQLGKRFGWSPLRLPLPLRGQGWLDVTYLSDNMRITRGNRGGLFVHIRPRMLTREAAEATKGILPVMM